MLEVVDNQNAPEIFASEVAGYTIAGGNLSLTLCLDKGRPGLKA